MTREQWSEVVASMITRGAKTTDAEFAEIIDYLAKNFPPEQPGDNASSLQRHAKGSASIRQGSKLLVDTAAAERGHAVYESECAKCHGQLARGGEAGPDLVRSVTVLHDRYGSALGPFLRKEHPSPGGHLFSSLSDSQIIDISHFLHQQVNNTLRSGPYTKVLNVLTGDPAAGAEYFKTVGMCSQCHSPTGDLAGIASRYDPPALQQRLLFPRVIGLARNSITPSKPVTVTVSTPDGHSASGVLMHLDDFTVSLRDADGNYHSWKRTPQIRVEEHDPYAVHDELLDHYTDKNIHDLVAYLETLK